MAGTGPSPSSPPGGPAGCTSQTSVGFKKAPPSLHHVRADPESTTHISALGHVNTHKTKLSSQQFRPDQNLPPDGSRKNPSFQSFLQLGCAVRNCGPGTRFLASNPHQNILRGSEGDKEMKCEGPVISKTQKKRVFQRVGAPGMQRGVLCGQWPPRDGVDGGTTLPRDRLRGQGC